MTGTGTRDCSSAFRMACIFAVMTAGLWAVLPMVTAGGAAFASSAPQTLPEEATECLECHEDEDMEKELSDGETLSLSIYEKDILGTVHGNLGCNGCHSDISLDDHPEEREIANRMEYRAGISARCENCHTADRESQSATHRYLNAKAGAPDCASCHLAHAIGDMEGWKAAVEESEYCLTCHDKNIQYTLGNGESLPLTISEGILRGSVHLEHECSDCHADFSKDDHSLRDFSSTREHSIALSEVCQDCHDDMYELFTGSIHFSLMENGNMAAPICTDCHGFHAVGPAAVLETIAGVPCRRCHENIFQAYEESMHGQARGWEGHTNAPICADCHMAHDVPPASWADRLKEACLACHEGVESVHAEWLPNAGLHIEAVSCPSCHSPKAARGIDLVLSDNGDGRPISEMSLRTMLASRDVAFRDFSVDGLNAVELWKLVREANKTTDGAPITFSGRLQVRTGLDAHRMQGKSKALRDCDLCHTKGAEAFDNVTISVLRDDGRIKRFSAEGAVLGSVASMESLRDFYALGSTRIGLLDLLLVMAVLGGMSVPTLHISARLLTRKK